MVAEDERTSRCRVKLVEAVVRDNNYLQKIKSAYFSFNSTKRVLFIILLDHCNFNFVLQRTIFSYKYKIQPVINLTSWERSAVPESK